MERLNIRVYVYENPHVVRSWDVSAFCVQGETGFFALFEHPEIPTAIAMAQGDDGHWWYESCFDGHWLPEYVAVFVAMAEHRDA